MPHLHHFPAWTDSNPYTNMLHQGIIAEGWKVTGTIRLDNLLTALHDLVDGDVLHVQWTRPIVQIAPNVAAARRALDNFRASVDEARERGVKLVWTVHNKVPHDLGYFDLEVELAEYLCAASDLIIQLNPHTAEAVADLYTLPQDKLTTLRHASYSGIYGEVPFQTDARRELGVPLSSPTVGFVGQIRHYKGVSTLLEALALLSERIEDVTLLLAGKTDPREADLLENALPRGIRAVRRHGFLPDSDVATWFSAADVMAFPYRNILNSGSLLLSSTYGRPAVLPAEPHLVAEYGDETWVSFYEPTGHAAVNLAAALEDALKTARHVRSAAAEYAEAYTTFDMAWGFAAILGALRAGVVTP